MLVLKKMTRAFEPGDPVLELAAVGKDVPHSHPPGEEHWVRRPEQEHIDRIITGQEVGHYYFILGEKGSGKSSMLIEAMRKIDGDGVAMFEAHADPEIVRIRLGKALDYEFHEDYIGGYFSEKGPRDMGALLDIERAMNKLEKVAMKLFRIRKKPLVVIVNQMHLLRNDDVGRNLIELLQQRAEQWAAAGLVTMVFNSDDYWVYERLKLLSTRMEVLPVTDLPKKQAIQALQRYRIRYFGEKMTQEQLDDKLEAAAMVLAHALVEKEESMTSTYDPVVGHILPTYPFHIAQEIMTRCDFIRDLDSLNLFTITNQADVRASSVPMHRAFREICSQPGFKEHLDNTIERIAAIESLGRTRELVAKDLVLGGQYDIQQERNKVTVRLKMPEEEEEKDN
ncbi:hypothetical protein E5D57_000976 [Metarhizium anisopliae]|nr:hypothetical protein E5D57_000976 [Metarhizium anisopliae]